MNEPIGESRGPSRTGTRATTIACPGDAALPGLRQALDSGAFAAHLERAWASGGVVLGEIDCQPHYLRYKPGTSALIGYRLTGVSDSGPVSTTLHAIVYAGDRAARLWQKGSLQALSSRAANLARAASTGIPPLFLPSLGAVVQPLPVDRKLPGMAMATAPDAMRAALARAFGGDIDQGLLAPPLEVTVLRYKPARKALLRYRRAAAASGKLGRHSQGSLFGKLHPQGQAPRLAAWQLLARGGMPMAPFVDHVYPLNLTLHAEVPGQALRAMRGTPEVHGWMAPAGALLAELHRPYWLAKMEGLGLPRRDEAAAVQAAAAAVAAVLPAEAALARDLGSRIASAFEQAGADRVVLHGDFYDDQLIQGEAGLTLIDWDELGVGHPLVDAGNMMAQLKLDAHLGRAGAAEASEAFLDAYTAKRAFPAALVSWFTAGALLKLAVAPLRHLDPDWPAQVADRLRLVAAALPGEARRRGRRRTVSGALQVADAPVASPNRDRADAVAGTVTAGTATAGTVTAFPDPALPQLAVALDATAMRSRLATALGQPVDEVAVTLVRHKRGRRAVVRYELKPGSGDAPSGRTVFGKAFASERGPAVFEAHRAIWSASDRLPFAVPEPLAYLPTLKMVLQGAVHGDGLAAVLSKAGPDRADALLGQTAAALAALHQAPIPWRRRRSLAGELESLGGHTATLVESVPHLGELARHCLEAVLAGASCAPPWRQVPIHRDFYPDQVQVGGDRLAILDWDDAGLGDPALDVANFAAHLRLLGWQSGRGDLVDELADGFIGHSAAAERALDLELVRLLEAATLLRLAGIHLPRPGGEALAERLLQASAARVLG